MNISYREYLHREYNIIHAPYEEEMDFYDSIRTGNVRRVKNLCKEPFHEKEGLGKLSDNDLRNMKYHYVISAAMIARTCISGGLHHSEAYNMSDYYIQKADRAKTIDEVSKIHDEMCIAYAVRMKQLNKETICSKHINLCIDYIYEHLNTRITVLDLALHTSLSEAYVSRLFKKETGYTVSRYILNKKIETARTMLKYTDYPIADISAALAFPSQSHFSKVYKDIYGETPFKSRNTP